MHFITLDSETDFDGWRNAARRLVLSDVSPTDITWRVQGDAPELFEPTAPAQHATLILEVSGNTPTTELAEKLGVTLGGRGGGAAGGGDGGGGAQSVGGLLIHALGRIPHPGERFTLKGLEFDILAASATRVERVAVRPGPSRVQPLDRPE